MYTNNHLDCIVNALDHIYQKREQYKGMRMLKILRPGSRWHYVGVIGVIALILTLSFYGGGVVAAIGQAFFTLGGLLMVLLVGWVMKPRGVDIAGRN